MGGYKHIESCVGEFLARRYKKVVEIGMGNNTVAAEILSGAGVLLLCTDIKNSGIPAGLPFAIDDIFSPRRGLYAGADVIYAIRPAIEMIPPLIDLAAAIDCDLIVYHLGFETYGRGGRIIDCGVRLHQYHASSEAIEEG